jgi:hypothetical protein
MDNWDGGVETMKVVHLVYVVYLLSLAGAFGSTATNQSADLHPVFTAQEQKLKEAYNYGREWRKKKKNHAELWGPWRKDLAKVRQPDYASWTAPNVVILTPTCVAAMKGYEDQMRYVDYEQGFKQVLDILSTPPRHIMVVVNLYAWPGINEFTDRVNRPARREDVEDVEFCMIVDGKSVLRPTEVKQLGNTVVKERNAPYLGINSAFISAYPGGTSTVSVYTIESESYTAYAATYILAFPAFDTDGRPTIPASARTIEVKAFRPTYEHSCRFDLHKLK